MGALCTTGTVSAIAAVSVKRLRACFPKLIANSESRICNYFLKIKCYFVSLKHFLDCFPVRGKTGIVVLQRYTRSTSRSRIVHFKLLLSGLYQAVVLPHYTLSISFHMDHMEIPLKI